MKKSTITKSFRSRLRHSQIFNTKAIHASASKKERYLNLRFLYGTGVYDFVWNDHDTGTDMICSLWRPASPPEDWYSLGDMVSPIREYPSASTTPPLVLVQPIAGKEDVLAAPIDYELIWADNGSGGSHDLSIWRPIAPDKYVSLGYIAQPGYDKPNRPDFRCVKKTVIVEASASFIFNDKGSGVSDNMSLWNIMGNAKETVPAGSFLATNTLYEPPAKTDQYAIKATAVLLNGVEYEKVLNPIPEVPESALIKVKLLTGNELQFRWNAKKSGADSPNVNFYDIDTVKDEYYSLGSGGMLAQYSQEDWKFMVFKDLTDNTDNPVLIKPTGFEQIWSDQGSGGDNDGSFWKMVAPSGYVAIGIICQMGYDKPDKSLYRCVREDILTIGSVQTKNAWNDRCTGVEKNFSCWYNTGVNSAALQTHLLSGYNQYATYPNQVFVINAAYCKGYNGRFGIINTLGNLKCKYHKKKLINTKLLAKKELEEIWNVSGFGGVHDLTVFEQNKKISRQGYKVIGHYGSTTRSADTAKAITLKAKSGFESLLQNPIAFKNVWRDRIWQPISPSGFVSLGVIASDGFPDPASYWCVHEDLAIPGAHGNIVWTDADTLLKEEKDVILRLPTIDRAQIKHKTLDTPLLTGTMFSQEHPAFALRKVNCDGYLSKSTPPSPKEIEKKLLTAQIAIKYKEVWSDRGSGGSNDGSFYKPVCPDGYFYLGSTGSPNYDAPKISDLKGIIVKPTIGNEDVLAPATGVKRLHYVRADKDGSFWQPKAPDGYVAMGIVVTSGKEKPNLDGYRCVREDLVRDGNTGAFVWNDKNTGESGDISCYRVTSKWGSRTSSCGTLSAVNYYGYPLSAKVNTLCTAYLESAIEPINEKQEKSLIETYGPIIRYHPDEKYFPVSIDEMLSRVNLYKGTETIETVTRETLMTHKDWQMELKSGAKKSGKIKQAKGYIHLNYTPLYTDLQFWTLHAYNGPGTVEVSALMANCPITKERTEIPPMGEHEGDWETVILRFANVSTDSGLPPLIEVGYIAHGNLVWYNISSVERDGDQVVSYSSLNGHGGYAVPGKNYSNEGGISGLVRWRLINDCDSGQELNLALEGKWEIAARTNYYDEETIILESAWEFEGRWGKSSREELNLENLTPFAWKALWPLVLEVYLVLIPISFINVIRIPLLFVTTAALVTSFIPGVVSSLAPRVEDDQDGPTPPPKKGSWNDNSDSSIY